MKKLLHITLAIVSSMLMTLTGMISPLFASGTWQAEFYPLSSVSRKYPLYTFQGDDRNNPYISWNDPLSYVGYFKVGNEVLFCLEPDILFEQSILYGSQAFNEQADAVLSQNVFGLGYTPEQIVLLSKIQSVGYGYQGDYSEAMAAATQICMWEVKHPGELYDIPSEVQEKRNQILERIKAFDTPVSFSQQTITFAGYGKENAIRLEDTNSVFTHYFSTSIPDHVQAQQEGNKLLVWLEKGASKTGTLSYQALYPSNEVTNSKKVYFQNNNQTIGSFGKIDTPSFSFHYQLDIAPQTQTVKADTSKEGNMNIHLQLLKTDSETKKPIPNVEFEFYKDDVLIHTASTNGQGTIEFKHQEKQTFQSETYEENYLVNFDAYDEASQNEWLAQGFHRNEADAKAMAQKKAEQDVNAKVQAYESSHHIYKAREVKSGKDYYLDPEKNWIVKEQTGSGTIEFEMSNQAIRGQIEIQKQGEVLVDHETIQEEVIKTNFEYALKGLEGVEFEILAQEDILDPADQSILYEKGQVVEKLTTDHEGKAFSAKLPLGNYVVHETKTKDGYVLDSTKYPIELKAENSETQLIVQKAKLENERKKAKIKIQKIDAESKKPLADSLFALSNKEKIAYVNPEGEEIEIEENTVLETQYSDKEGNVRFEADLPYGSYTIEEIEAPQGYVRLEKIETIEKEQWQTGSNPFEYLFENDFETIKVQVQKVDMQNQPIVSLDFEFALYDEEGEMLQNMEGDPQNGTVLFSIKRAGTYSIQETKAPNGYDRSKRKVKIVVDEKGTVSIDDQKQEKQAIYTFAFQNEKTKVVAPKVPTSMRTGLFASLAVLVTSIVLIVWIKRKLS
ncbi:MSCRAMM family protein [Dubosiella newyorkensis]|uniref:MSCRAMM family protein n=1 Tax=Dubosiella newyorkensis TaxID=1862672 RepID=UPI00272B9197|nr:SpaA isopeptide-forming pilin-related protein [Dubosiella newyorkensis]